MQGGSLQGKVGSVFAEKLKIIKALEGGDLGSLLSGLMGSGGLSSILQGDPTMGAMSQLQSAITTMLGQVSAGMSSTGSDGSSGSTPTYPATLAAVTALQTAATSFAAQTQGLAGVGPAVPYGPLDVILHANTVGTVGAPAPTNLSLATVIAPLEASPTITSAQNTAQEAVAGLIVGTIADADAAASVTAATASLTSIATASTSAITGLQNVLPVLATAQAFAAATVSTNPDLLAYVTSIVQPSVLAQLKAQAEAEFYIEPPTITTVAPLINQGNAIMTWLTQYAAQTGTTIEVV